jgi:drug/metabolite transporter (DMT)-like permease
MSDTVSHRSSQSARLVGIGLVNLATLTWATNITLGRWLRDAIGPLTLSAARFSLASLVFVVLLQRRPTEERRLGTDRKLLLGMALAGVVAFAPTLYLGLRYTTAASATLINGLGPIITGVLAALLIREPMSRSQIAGALVALIGVIGLVSGNSLAFLQTSHVNPGNLVVLAAVTLWAVYSVLSRRVTSRRSSLSATALSAFLGLPLLLLAAAWELRTSPVQWSPQLVLAVAYIGIAPTVIGFLAWNEGVRRLGSSGAMVFYNTLPLYGALMGYLLLGESIGITHILSAVLIIGGGLLAAAGRRSSVR